MNRAGILPLLRCQSRGLFFALLSCILKTHAHNSPQDLSVLASAPQLTPRALKYPTRSVRDPSIFKRRAGEVRTTLAASVLDNRAIRREEFLVTLAENSSILMFKEARLPLYSCASVTQKSNYHLSPLSPSPRRAMSPQENQPPSSNGRRRGGHIFLWSWGRHDARCLE